MPKLHDDTPVNLKPFIHHGLDLSWSGTDKQANGECPFCSKPKFSVEIATGLYRCLVCATGTDKGGGNIYTFLRKLHEACGTEGIEELAETNELEPDTLIEWGIVKSIITGEWLVPGYSVDGQIHNLYRYAKSSESMALKGTTGIHHQLFGMQFWDDSKEIVVVNEGWKDGMAMWEIVRQAKETEEGFKVTGNVDSSLYGNMNVVAVPGCTTFLDSWLSLFADKIVYLAYDNDHPRTHENGKEIRPGGFDGMKRTAALLSAYKEPPKEIHYLAWSKETGYNMDLPHGYDCRDMLHA
jgi:hypothetical protein